jgi:hemolysin-activating ACP:hemolysin acyltransferase
MTYYQLEAEQKEIIFTPDYIQNKNELFGRIIALMADSDVYLPDSLYALKKNITSPLCSNNCLIYFSENKLVGYCSWAWLTDESEKKYMENSNSLVPNDWETGDNLWLIDTVAPYSSKHAINLMKYARKHVRAQGKIGIKVKFKRYYDRTNYKIQEVEL